MKILYIVGSLDKRDGGSVQVVLELVQTLAKNGIDVTIFAPLPNNQEETEEYQGIKIRYFRKTGLINFLAKYLWQKKYFKHLSKAPIKEFSRIGSVDTNKHHYFNLVLYKIAKFLAEYFLWLRHSKPLKEALMKEISEFDLIHIYNLWHYPHLVACKAAIRANKPYIVTVQGELTPWALKRKNIFSIITQKKILKNASAIHVLSKNEATNVTKFTNNPNIVIIPNGINLEEFEKPTNKDWLYSTYPGLKNKKIILFLGRITAGKGLETLTRAFANVIKKEPDSRLLIVGPDSWGYKPKIENIIKKENLLGKVIFTGMLEGVEKLTVLNCANIFVLLSESEGFSLTILEALYCRLPVIISPQCNFPEVEKAGTGKIINIEVKQLADIILELLNNSRICEKMGINGRNLIVKGEYNYDNIIPKIIEIYKKVIKKD